MNDNSVMRRALLLAALLLFGCHRGTPKVNDQDMQRLRAELPGMSAACLDKLRWGGIEALPKKDEECFQFTLPMRMQGLWRNDFEGSEYCDGPVAKCPDARVDADPSSGTWFENWPPPAGWEDTPPGGLYAVDFIGRRSIGEGAFGHLGMAKNEVIVDRLLSIRLVEPPRPPGQMTKEHIEGYRKECAEASLCMPNTEVPAKE